jgi:hypothetical protein
MCILPSGLESVEDQAQKPDYTAIDVYTAYATWQIDGR